MKLGRVTGNETRCFWNLRKNVLIFTVERLRGRESRRLIWINPWLRLKLKFPCLFLLLEKMPPSLGFVFRFNCCCCFICVFSCLVWRSLRGEICFVILWCFWFVVVVWFVKGKGTLKQQVSALKPVLEEWRSKKEQRVKEFSETQLQIARICAEIAGNGQYVKATDPQVDECDLTVKRLGELKAHLHELQNEKVCFCFSLIVAVCT